MISIKEKYIYKRITDTAEICLLTNILSLNKSNFHPLLKNFCAISPFYNISGSLLFYFGWSQLEFSSNINELKCEKYSSSSII